jgi:hypothetical protein
VARNTKSVGVSGLDQHQGFIFEDFLDEMRGTNKYRNLNEMRLNNSVVAAAMTAIKFPIKNIGWFYVSDKGEDDPRLKILERSRAAMNMPWGDHIMEALTFVDFGFAPLSIKYQKIKGEWLWDKFFLLGQDTIRNWDIKPDGDVTGLWQHPHLYKPRIPMEKILLFRANTERNNPEGRSMLRSAFTSYYYVRELTKIEAIGKERGMAGIPVIVMPETADDSPTSSDYTKAQSIVRNIRNDEQAGVVLPYGWELDLLNTGVNSEIAMNQTIQRHESRMLMSMLSQFIMLGLNSVGTQSKAESDMDLFNIMIDAVADIISEVHTTQAIPRLMALHGLESDGLRMEHSPPGDIDFLELAQAIAMLGPDSITWTAEDEVHTRSVLRLPKIQLSELTTLREQRKQEMLEEEILKSKLKGQPRDQSDRQRGGQGVESGSKPQKSSLAGHGSGSDARGANRQRRLFGVEITPADVAGNAPDDDVRLKHEKLWYGKGVSYFSDLLRRIESGAG